ncbi:hypothetical protein PV328_012147 [Microctonus aethiopoides]|uniref:Uncharacterized protein n=1 Tax=Microctonus aethiopoides TaxID=144406 RepID=A0AA39EWS7_9HYME|nr:hypothetical protein PV328_012147 [Microctonus aethiopoides]
MFTDEATFQRNGFINQRNKHFWALENPLLVDDSKSVQDRFKKNVWMGIIGGKVDGAPAHTSGPSMAHLGRRFPGRLISKRGDNPPGNRRLDAGDVCEEHRKSAKTCSLLHRHGWRPFRTYPAPTGLSTRIVPRKHHRSSYTIGTNFM